MKSNLGEPLFVEQLFRAQFRDTTCLFVHPFRFEDEPQPFLWSLLILYFDYFRIFL